jgi:hypothetical protein
MLFSIFAENEWAFDLLYCVAFVVMDKQWLETNATYMQFNVRKLMFICKKKLCFIEEAVSKELCFFFILIITGHLEINASSARERVDDR